MRLRQIKMAGFKSFADATVIATLGQRVGVVGPNGCGKSNVIDAVRWVLGESSARQLRGESMQDVIFNGTHSRPPASKASVELVFDNSDFALSGEWGQFSEVSIRRTLSRSGESAYFINKQQVRRRDITDLFLGTGVGVRGYAVIEQGMISRIIEARPEELRAFIEEAAGVSKYKERRRETENRLDDSREHLSRLADLQSELDRQSEKLAQQVQTVERYQNFKATLNQAQNRLDYYLWNQAHQAQIEAQDKASCMQTELDALALNISQINEEILAFQVQEHLLRDEEGKIAAQWMAVREEAARLEEKMRYLVDQRKRREREQAQTESEQYQISRENNHLNERLQQLTALQEEYRFQWEEAHLVCDELIEALPEAQEKLNHAEQAYESLRTRTEESKRDCALIRQKIEHYQNRLSQLAPQNMPEDWQMPQLEGIQKQREELTLRCALLQKQVHSDIHQREQLQQQLEAARERLHGAEKEDIALKSEYTALSRLLEQQNDEDDQFWIHNHQGHDMALRDAWQACSPWQMAVSQLLSSVGSARAVDNLIEGAYAWVAVQPLEYPQRLPVDSIVHQLHMNASFEAFIVDFLAPYRCAHSLEEAWNNRHNLQANECFITPDGQKIYRNGVIACEETPQAMQRTRLMELEQQLPKMAENLNQARSEVIRLDERKAEFQGIADQTRILFDERTQALHQTEQQWAKLQSEAALVAQRKADFEHAAEQNAQEIERINHEIDQLQNHLDSLAQDDENQLLVIEEQVRRLRLNHSQSAQKQLDAERKAHQIDLLLQKNQQDIDALHHQQKALQEREFRLNQKQNELDLPEDTAKMAEEMQQQWENLHAIGLQFAEQSDEMKNRLNALQQKASEAHRIWESHQNNLPIIQKKQQDAALSAQQAQLKAEQFFDKLTAQNVNFADLAEDHHGLSVDDLHQVIASYTQKINNLGAINWAAEAEFSQAKERGAYLAHQRDDLLRAMDMLQAAIVQMDNESARRFNETFSAVNRHIAHYFPLLFGGGEATLTLDSDDLLNCGVHLMAHPPGKRNSSIHQLSGGEKALTAMSLVFALFSLNPAPFCLLDEVDAPLDDANKLRFCHLIEQMSENTQFLYISHNRSVMEMAQQLIGVTTQEKGVSRIVSVDLQAAFSKGELHL